jgi:alkyl sulfatase BDS1-like metallo-beta-lactamase superfamily hydrolase
VGAVLDLAERAWRGELEASAARSEPTRGSASREANEVTTALQVHPGNALVAFEELGAGLGFLSAFSNVAALATDDGLVLLDTSSLFHAQRLFEELRRWSERRVHTAVYTHGHVDHVFGLAAFEQEAEAKGWPRVRVIAHENCPPRFERYRLTQGWNAIINQRQFGFPKPVFPARFREPDETMGDARTLDVGGIPVELRHDKGETDDHVWAWLPSLRTLYTGDLFIWAAPNCGNPQKVQRYPREWAAALRKMAALGAERLLPGHGPPILGAARVAQALAEAAELLESLVDQTLALMNAGATLDEVLRGVKLPERLLARPYLRPTYDDPRFVVRNLWRLYGGWWDGDPAHLLPAPAADLAQALAALAGGAQALAAGAENELARGRLDLACHLVELAVQAAPEDARIHGARATIYTERRRRETSLMAKGVFGAAARESEAAHHKGRK